MVREVNNQPYLLTCDRPSLTSKGPKQSTPMYVNGGLPGVVRSFGSSAMNCSAGLAFLLWQSFSLSVSNISSSTMTN